MTANDGSQITLDYLCDGVGSDAVIRLKDSNLIVTEEAFANDGVVTLGTIDTTADTGNRYTDAGNLNDILINGSYTNDDGNRAGYQNIGTVISLNAGHAGDLVSGKNLNLNQYTLVRIDTALNGNGTVTSDIINLDGALNAGGARVFGTVVSGLQNEAAIGDQTRVKIASMGSVQSAFNEDMLYDVSFNPVTGTYQRDLRTLNVWVDTAADGVYLTYSKNYLGADKNANQSEIASVIEDLANRVDHTEGTLGASSSVLDQFLNALDYTRSEADALRALDSISGTTNTIAQHSMIDGNRHHLDTLRANIGMPWCDEVHDPKSTLQVSRESSVWFAYNGGYDSINGDDYMGDYTRTYQGMILGYERSINCNFLLGIDFGYENSIARTTGTKFEANTYFIDLYGSARTGRFNHRFSVGVGIYDFDTKRDVYIAAGSHTLYGHGTGDVTGTALNVGYELNTSFQVGKRSEVTPFLLASFSYNHLGDFEEKGLGNAGLKTDYDNFSQFDMGVGARFSHHFGLVKNQAPATLFASVAAMFEFGANQPKATNSFLADPALNYKVKSLDRAPFYIQMGAGLDVPISNRWSATVTANGEVGKDRAGVGGSIGARYTF